MIKIKSAIHKIIVPAFAEFGYTLYSDTDRHYLFHTADKTRHIEINRSRGALFLAAAAISGDKRFVDLDNNHVYVPKMLEIEFTVLEPFWINIRSDWASTSETFGEPNLFFYKDQEELEDVLRAMVKKATEKIFPYMDQVIEYYIPLTTDIYKGLSDNAAARAYDFAQKHGLPAQATRESVAMVETILMQYRRDAVGSERKARFFEYYDEIMSLTAYFGESFYRAENESMVLAWGWVDDNGLPCDSFNPDAEPDGMYSYKILPYEGKGGFDPLGYVLEFWNFYPEWSERRLVRLISLYSE
jgi:hypothetical protein